MLSTVYQLNRCIPRGEAKKLKFADPDGKVAEAVKKIKAVQKEEPKSLKRKNTEKEKPSESKSKRKKA